MKELKATLKKYDLKPNNQDDRQIDQICSNISKDKPMNLILFTCSTIEAKYMFSHEMYDSYVSLDPAGNNLTDDLPTIKALTNELDQRKVPYKLNILIGNTDPYYIYSSRLRLMKGISKKEYLKRMGDRWSGYKTNFEKWVQKGLALDPSRYEILSWYEYESKVEKGLGISFEKMFIKVRKNYKEYFEPSDLRWELSKLKTHFGPGKYFEGLERPDDKVLREWIINKFTEYAVQGWWIYTLFPNSVLLQNEKPTDLRYKMYQPLIRKYCSDSLANIYPFGIDNSGYQ